MTSTKRIFITALNEKSFDLPSFNPLALYPSAYFLKPQLAATSLHYPAPRHSGASHYGLRLEAVQPVRRVRKLYKDQAAD